MTGSGTGTDQSNQSHNGTGFSDEERIARHLRDTVLGMVSGSGEKRVHMDLPSDRFFAGVLAPRDPRRIEDSGDDDLHSKMQPSALGVTVKIRNGQSGDSVVLNVSGAVWLRVNPTYAEMQRRETYVSLGDEQIATAGERELLPVFSRFELDVPPVEIPYKSLMEAGRETPGVATRQMQEALEEAFEDVYEQAIEDDDTELYRQAEDDSVPPRALENESTFQEYLEGRTGEPAIPNWSAGLEVTTREDPENPGEYIVDFEFSNTAQQDLERMVAATHDPSLFEVQLDLHVERDDQNAGLEFVPFTFDPLPKDFRYNRDLWGHGRNCTVIDPAREEQIVDDDGRTAGRSVPESDPTSEHLQTRYAPIHRQLKYESAERELDEDGETVEPTFEILSNLENGGYDLLERVGDAMEEYEQTAYDNAYSEYSNRDDWDVDDNDEDDFEEAREAFKREIERFRRGICCLREHPDTVGRAFELMNQTMGDMHEYDSWRLFQLVFIVIEIPDIASREYDQWDEVTWRHGTTNDRAEEVDSPMDIVDVLWFPTGGGKTEAFLGVAVWNMFFDRLRGKDFGVTAWTRFPLRLLSLQQLQRITEAISYAELIRREQSDIGTLPSRPFSVGYLVGKRNTPNALNGYNNNTEHFLDENQEEREEKKVIPECPVCGSAVRMEVTNDSRLAHVCTGSPEKCDWQQRPAVDAEPYASNELPVHVVDNELFRYAPSIIGGTIDKITSIGYQRKMAHILTGQMDCECPEHGFASLGECTEKYGCDIDRDEFADVATPVEPYDPSPSLQVPDELHLAKESMGSFDGHYETGIDTLQQLANAGRTKVIAPTATITAFENQVYHLFQRAAERFPAPGPYLRENFYAVEQPETQRYYVGLTPHGKTHINSIIDILFYFHREIQRLLEIAVDDPEELLTGAALNDDLGRLDANSLDEVLHHLTKYTTSLTYLLTKRDGDRLDQSIVNQLDDYLRREEQPPLTSDQMTGGTRFERVQEVLDELDNPWNSGRNDNGEETGIVPEGEDDGDRDRRILDHLAEEGFVNEGDIDTILEVRDLLESSLFEDGGSDEFRVALRRAGKDIQTGLAWLLASRLNAITATSMISHGVDVDRFNMMVFFGMPRATAEYIQSSSRAGRKFPGLVFTVFHPIRERDQSHYHFFEKYHAFLDRLVEPVAINRWAKNSVRQTHPGLLMGLLLNHYMYTEDAGRLYFGSAAEDLMQDLDRGELIDTIRRMYGNGDADEEFIWEAETLTEEAADQIEMADNQWTSGRLPSDPMRSLRDIDEQLPIRPEYRSQDLLERFEER